MPPAAYCGGSCCLFSAIDSRLNKKLIVLSAPSFALTPPVPEQTWRVDYRAALDRETLDLASGQNLRSQPPTRPGTDAAHVLTVTVGDTAAKRAGRYEDIITIEIRGTAL